MADAEIDAPVKVEKQRLRLVRRLFARLWMANMDSNAKIASWIIGYCCFIRV